MVVMEKMVEIQRFLERKNIKFTGSNSLASSIAMNKDKSKNICLENNIPTPPWCTLNKNVLNKSK